eukprot:TRINITY_DN33410_c0_g1_i1.p1 TRINITY_DN33410_c0_g1~~TRINITY_DN33410_c0_g1_i1.p1  ORF type:complete len:300 (+),score=108.95 TRINITY_DN33410_c0_g1_i1:55-900(+)
MSATAGGVVVGGLCTATAVKVAHAVIAMPSEARTELLSAFAASFVVSCGVHRAFTAVSSGWLPKRYAEKPERKALWSATGLSLLWPSWAVPLAVSLSPSVPPSSWSVNVEADWGIRVATGLSLGYMAYDLLDLAWWNKRDYKKASGTPLWRQMFAHHLLSLLIWPYGIAAAKAVQPITYFLATEVTNVGMNMRWLMNECDHSLTTPVSLLWILSFVIVRVVPAPFLLHMLATGDYSSWDPVERVMGALCVIPVGLNFFWFYFIIKGLRKKFSKGGQKPKAK